MKHTLLQLQGITCICQRTTSNPDIYLIDCNLKMLKTFPVPWERSHRHWWPFDTTCSVYSMPATFNLLWITSTSTEWIVRTMCTANHVFQSLKAYELGDPVTFPCVVISDNYLLNSDLLVGLNKSQEILKRILHPTSGEHACTKLHSNSLNKH